MPIAAFSPITLKVDSLSNSINYDLAVAIWGPCKVPAHLTVDGDRSAGRLDDPEQGQRQGRLACQEKFQGFKSWSKWSNAFCRNRETNLDHVVNFKSRQLFCLAGWEFRVTLFWTGCKPRHLIWQLNLAKIYYWLCYLFLRLGYL